MGLEILVMININRFHQLENEVWDMKNKIIRQVALVHDIVGVDSKSDRYVLIDIDRVYEMIDEKTNIPYIVIMSHFYSVAFQEWHFSTVRIKKELFEMTEEELRENQERLSKELEETNQKQFDSVLAKSCGYGRLAIEDKGDE